MRLKNRFSESTRKTIAAIVGAIIVFGALFAIVFGAETYTDRQPAEWPGVTVHEDGSVTVDTSPGAQNARSEIWVSGCEWRGNGEC